jgi:hypothetical protein
MILLFLTDQVLYSLTVMHIKTIRTGDIRMMKPNNDFTGEELKIITEIKD